MHCKYHKQKEAENKCACCGSGLCVDCSQAIISDEFYCYSCALFTNGHYSKEADPIKYILFSLTVIIIVLVLNIIFP